MSSKNESFYEILGLNEKCNDDEIKKAYRKLSFMHHPDKNNNSAESTEKFQKITQAYEILSDPDKRREYDLTKNNPFLNGGRNINPMDIFNMFMNGGGGGGPGPIPGMGMPFPFPIFGGGINIQPMNPMNPMQHMNNMHMNNHGQPPNIQINGLGGLGGLFTNLFNGQMNGNNQDGPKVIIRTFTNNPNNGQPEFHENIIHNMNPNMNPNMNQNINQSMNGNNSPKSNHSNHQSNVYQQQEHPYKNNQSHPQQNEIMRPPLISLNVKITLEQSCKGEIIPIEYERWNITNEGLSTLEKCIEQVHLPVGCDNGEAIILGSKGNINEQGIIGDVKITLHLLPHPIFKRNNLDLFMEKNISFKESICGFSFDVLHINGKSFQFNNNPGNIIKDGLLKTIPKLGIERNGEKGNLNIKFIINYPESLTQEQAQKISEIL